MQKSILDEDEFFELIKINDTDDERGHNPSQDFRPAAEHVRSRLGMQQQNLKSSEGHTLIIFGRAHNIRLPRKLIRERILCFRWYAARLKQANPSKHIMLLVVCCPPHASRSKNACYASGGLPPASLNRFLGTTSSDIQHSLSHAQISGWREMEPA